MAEHESRSLLQACDGEMGESEDSPRLDGRLPAAWSSMPRRPPRMHQVAAICVVLVACWAAVSTASRQHGGPHLAGVGPVQLGELTPDEPPGHNASKIRAHRGEHKASSKLKKKGPKKTQKASTRRRDQQKAEDVAEAPPATTTEQPDEPEASDSDDATGDGCAEIKVWRGKCHTSTPGETCFSSVDWALKVGLPSHPNWYSGIEADATFEDLQGYLHDHHFQLSCCPPPCKPGASAAPPGTAEGAGAKSEDRERRAEHPEEGDDDGGRAGCRPVAEGDPCYEAVDWAMTVGILQHPEWYEGEGMNLTGDSAFEEFQQFLHDERKMCPAPCRSSTAASKISKGATTRAITTATGSLTSSTTSRTPSSTRGSSSTSSSSSSGSSSSRSSRSSSTTAISDTGSSCKTSAKGDDCHLSVVWAMEHGIKKHADWYPGLSGDSTFEEFQRVLHDKFPAMSRCSLPCSSSAGPAAAKVLDAAPRSIQDSQVITAVEERVNRSALAPARGGRIKSSPSAATATVAKQKVKNLSAATATPAIHDAGTVEAPDYSEALAVEAAYEDDMTSVARLAAPAASAGGNRGKEVETGAAGVMASV